MSRAYDLSLFIYVAIITGHSYAQDSVLYKSWAIEPSFSIAASTPVYVPSSMPNILFPATLSSISVGISVLKNMHRKHTIGGFVGYRPLNLVAELNTVNKTLDSGFQGYANSIQLWSSTVNHLLSLRFIYRYHFYTSKRILLDIGGYVQSDLILGLYPGGGLQFSSGDSFPPPSQNVLASIEVLYQTTPPVIPSMGIVLGVNIKNKRVPLQSWRFSWETQLTLSRIWTARISEPGTAQNYDQSFDVFEWWNGLRIAYAWGINRKKKR